jgi:hypothetical protein
MSGVTFVPRRIDSGNIHFLRQALLHVTAWRFSHLADSTALTGISPLCLLTLWALSPKAKQVSILGSGAYVDMKWLARTLLALVFDEESEKGHLRAALAVREP